MELLPFQMRTWADINLDSICENFKIVQSQVEDKVKVCCVIKANAYGHGAVQLAKVYEREGADFFAVSNIEEAIQLREANIKLPVLILGYTDPRCVMALAQNDLSQCVFSKEYAKLLSMWVVKQGVAIKIHIKIDTGMGRIGFKCRNEDDSDLQGAIYVCGLPGLIHEGIFTHFASADEGAKGKEYTERQFNYFMHAIDYLKSKGISFSIRHCANSAAIFDYPNMHLDMVRAGIVLYGLQPSDSLHNVPPLKPALTLKTIIDHIKKLEAGDCVSYGREFIAAHNMIIATIPIGYADGLWRSNYKNHMTVEVEGKLAPVVGRICMDQCMIDISDIPEAGINSKVIVYGQRDECSVDTVAAANDTINYEILCAIGERVPRVYKENGNISAVEDNIIPIK